MNKQCVTSKQRDVTQMSGEGGRGGQTAQWLSTFAAALTENQFSSQHSHRNAHKCL